MATLPPVTGEGDPVVVTLAAIDEAVLYGNRTPVTAEYAVAALPHGEPIALEFDGRSFRLMEDRLEKMAPESGLPETAWVGCGQSDATVMQGFLRRDGDEFTMVRKTWRIDATGPRLELVDEAILEVPAKAVTYGVENIVSLRPDVRNEIIPACTGVHVTASTSPLVIRVPLPDGIVAAGPSGPLLVTSDGTSGVFRPALFGGEAVASDRDGGFAVATAGEIVHYRYGLEPVRYPSPHPAGVTVESVRLVAIDWPRFADDIAIGTQIAWIHVVDVGGDIETDVVFPATGEVSRDVDLTPDLRTDGFDLSDVVTGTELRSGGRIATFTPPTGDADGRVLITEGPTGPTVTEVVIAAGTYDEMLDFDGRRLLLQAHGNGQSQYAVVDLACETACVEILTSPGGDATLVGDRTLGSHDPAAVIRIG